MSAGHDWARLGPCWRSPTVTRSHCALGSAASLNGKAWCGAVPRAGGVEPFLDYQGAELVSWLRAADEAAEHGWPAPLRTEIPVNSTIPAVGPQQAHDIARAAGCRTAKIKVAERGQTLADDASGGSGTRRTRPGRKGADRQQRRLDRR